MEHGFYHPDNGYWQAIGGDVVELLSSYPEGTLSVPLRPGANYEWQNGEWVYVEPVVVVPDSVSSRQFKMQLSIAGLKPQVEAWVSSRDVLTQIAYAESGSFVRGEPMMQTGFGALGFTSEEIDAFFLAASLL